MRTYRDAIVEILRSVEDRLEALARRGEGVDWLTFVPDGEPTLDANLGETIELLRTLCIPIAVITNSSLLWREGVREVLRKTDWLSVKVDATDPDLWRRVNRPDPALKLDAILGGISSLATSYRGTLTTETMLERIGSLGEGDLASLFYHPDFEFFFITLGHGDDGYPYYVYSTQSPLHRVVNAFTERGYTFVGIGSL